MYVGTSSVPWSDLAFAIMGVLLFHHGNLQAEDNKLRRSLQRRPDLHEYVQTFVHRLERAEKLVEMRHDGANAHFGRQFFRTIALRSSDPRDKVFGLLGVSKFHDHETTIVPDYTKSISEVSSEVTGAVLKDHFMSYIRIQPWRVAKTGPNWGIDLERIGRARKAHSFTTAYEKNLGNALQRVQNVAPILELSSDSSTLLTVGNSMGKILATDDLDPYDRSLFLRKVITRARAMDMDLSAQDLLRAILIPYNTLAFDHEKALADFEALLDPDSGPYYAYCASALANRYNWEGTAFLTDKGHIGVYYRKHYSDDNDGTLYAAALFGIRLPFILRRMDRGQYRLWALAHVGGHTLGDEDVEAMETGDDWRDLVKRGKMRKVAIV